MMPYQLAQVDLDCGEHSGYQTGQHDGAWNIALRVVRLLRQSSDAIEPNVGEDRQRCAVQYRTGERM